MSFDASMCRHYIKHAALLAELLLALGGLVQAGPAVASKDAVSCTLGPVVKTFGDSSWLVYGCNDGHSVVVVSTPGNPAAPFYFIITPGLKGVDLHGEGTGNREASAAALQELKVLNQAGLVALFKEAKAHAPTHPQGQALLSPSELNANVARYNGQTVVVRGYLTIVPEGHNLYESKHLNEEFGQHVAAGGKDNFNPTAWDKFCLTIANPGPLRQHQANFNGKTLILTGKFVDDYVKSNMVDIGACPLPTALFVDYADLQKRYPLLFK